MSDSFLAACRQRCLDAQHAAALGALETRLTDDDIELIVFSLDSFGDVLRAKRVCRRWRAASVRPTNSWEKQIVVWSLVTPYLMTGDFCGLLSWSDVGDAAARFEDLMLFLRPQYRAQRAKDLAHGHGRTNHHTIAAMLFTREADTMNSDDPATRVPRRVAFFSLVCHSMSHGIRRHIDEGESMH